eukprot:SAG31_NODE_295_length_18239_cov_15.063065_5_plen_908_part_00
MEWKPSGDGPCAWHGPAVLEELQKHGARAPDRYTDNTPKSLPLGPEDWCSDAAAILSATELPCIAAPELDGAGHTLHDSDGHAIGCQTARGWIMEGSSTGQFREAMPPQFAADLILDASFQPGVRPCRVLEMGDSARVFKESREMLVSVRAQRKMQGDKQQLNDRWHSSGGVSQSRDLPKEAPVVRRRYGTIQRDNRAIFSYHEYSLLRSSEAEGSSGQTVVEDRTVVIFHVLDRRSAQRLKMPVAMQMSPPSELFATAVIVNEHDSDRTVHSTIQTEFNTDSLSSAAGGNGQPSGTTQSSANKSVSWTLDTNVDIKPAYRLQQDRAIIELRGEQSAETEFVSFSVGSSQHSRGHVVGTERGLKLTSLAGDFAEYHKIKLGETPPTFNEGELVGLVNGEITRRTSDADMLGIISRRAAVVGSCPFNRQNMLEYDTVAYCGRVPVKIRGDATPGAFIIPSGFNDGSGVAVTRPDLSQAGRAVAVVERVDSCSSQSRDCEVTSTHSACPARLVDAVVLGPVNKHQIIAKAGMVRRVWIWKAAWSLVAILCTLLFMLSALWAHLHSRGYDFSGEVSVDSDPHGFLHLQSQLQEISFTVPKCHANQSLSLLQRHCGWVFEKGRFTDGDFHSNSAFEDDDDNDNDQVRNTLTEETGLKFGPRLCRKTMGLLLRHCVDINYTFGTISNDVSRGNSCVDSAMKLPYGFRRFELDALSTLDIWRHGQEGKKREKVPSYCSTNLTAKIPKRQNPIQMWRNLFLENNNMHLMPRDNLNLTRQKSIQMWDDLFLENNNMHLMPRDEWNLTARDQTTEREDVTTMGDSYCKVVLHGIRTQCRTCYSITRQRKACVAATAAEWNAEFMLDSGRRCEFISPLSETIDMETVWDEPQAQYVGDHLRLDRLFCSNQIALALQL